MKKVQQFLGERFSNLKHLAKERPAIKWLLLAACLQALLAGFVYDAINVLLTMYGHQSSIPVFAGWMISGGIMGTIGYVLLNLKWEKQLSPAVLHRRQVNVIFVGAILLGLLIFTYSLTLLHIEIVILVGALQGCMSSILFVAVTTLFKCYLPKKSTDHIGFTWIRQTLWILFMGITRIGGLWYIESDLPLIIWGLIGGMASIGIVVPVMRATQVQEMETPSTEEVEKRLEYKEEKQVPENQEPPLPSLYQNPFFLLLLITATEAISTIFPMANQRFIPLYSDASSSLDAFILFSTSIGIVLGGFAAYLIDPRHGARTVKFCLITMTVVTCLFSLTNHGLILAMGLFITGLAQGLFIQIVHQRLWNRVKNKTLATVLPFLPTKLLDLVALSGYGYMGVHLGYNWMYLFMVPIGFISLFGLRWFKPYLKDSTQ